MICQFLLSKDNNKICSYNNKLLHSSYNPIKEAMRFVDSINADFEPTYIVFTGPCLPYAVPFLQKKFFQSKIVAIQYTNDFIEYNNSFFATIVVDPIITEIELSEKLFNIIGDENIFSTLFISWPPSEAAFEKKYSLTWNAIKQTIQKCSAILNTRQFFNKRWLKNTINFFKNTKQIATIKKTNLPIIIVASGPSLKNSLDFIKQNQEKAIIFALSSAISVLIENSILPDFVITTDGGFWAKEHLKSLQKIEKKIPVIAPTEANIPFKVLQNSPIIPLDYNDNLDHFLFEKILQNQSNKILYAKRNGTVAGTAVELALNLTSNKIYFAGLDLASSKGFSHTEPNELEKNNNKDNKIASLENRITPSTFKNDSLLIYRNWFETRNNDFYKKVFRLVTDADSLNPIKNINDINVKNLKIEDKSKQKELYINENFCINEKSKIIEILNCEYRKIEKSKYNECSMINDFWYKSGALVEYLKFLKAGSDQKEECYKIVVNKTLETIKTLIDMLEND